MNKISVLLEKDSNENHTKDNINYYGIKLLWPDTKIPLQLNFKHFCQIGINTIFGTNQPENCIVNFFAKWTEEHLPITTAPTKVRRLYIEKIDQKFYFFFRTGVKTDLCFDLNDDPKVVEWLNLKNLQSKQWLDVFATAEMI